MHLRKAARVILVGAPGVGKGTQTERMLQRYPQLSSISTGDLLRDNVRRKTALGIQAEHFIKSGSLVPDSTILRLIMSELTGRGWIKSTDPAKPLTLNFMAPTADAMSPEADNFITSAPSARDAYEYSDSPDASFILDGFPRTAAQAKSLDVLLPVNLVVNIKTPVSVVLDRICNRWIHAPSGRVYNTTFNAPKVPGKDDITGEPLIQRDDDKPEVWTSRLAKFEESSLPLLEHYDRKGLLWTVQGNTSDEISPLLFDEFNKRFCA
ncbi:mitochondrial adenylate kinase [Myriangium duriaei CBS 260.36]|uniref:GTP:AMP phosphotransferase, mitochondrial n=1 Tax=Myriangium duriaei CBS 260.36 TaxID=1168546 RepID=A0A9P4J5R8_9PEZI|nr:mitochondrial adenylate kinase [Myriangium duriaei CBS 260.36]